MDDTTPEGRSQAFEEACRTAGIPADRPAYSLRKTAKILGISPATAAKWAARGAFPAPVRKYGVRTFRVLAADIDALIARTVGGAA